MLGPLKSLAGRSAVIRNSIVSVSSALEKNRVRSVIEDLDQQQDVLARSLGAGLNSFLQGDSEAASWIEKIETHRARLMADERDLADGTLGDAAMHDIGQSVKDVVLVSKKARSAALLFHITRALKPKNIIEMGTNVGISSAYIGAGQIASQVAAPALVTMEFSPYRARIAQGIHHDIGLEQVKIVLGDFKDTLALTLSDIEAPDLIFIDGNHKFKPTLRYTEMFLENATKDAVFIYDDIRWSDGMEKAWKQLMDHPEFQTVLDLNTMGISVRSADAKARYRGQRLYSVAV